MCFFINVSKLINSVVRVNLRGGEAAMAFLPFCVAEARTSVRAIRDQGCMFRPCLRAGFCIKLTIDDQDP